MQLLSAPFFVAALAALVNSELVKWTRVVQAAELTVD